jgi:hypothetical protein
MVGREVSISIDPTLLSHFSVIPIAAVELRIALSPLAEIVFLPLAPVASLSLVMTLLATCAQIIDLLALKPDDDHLIQRLCATAEFAIVFSRKLGRIRDLHFSVTSIALASLSMQGPSPSSSIISPLPGHMTVVCE